MARDWVAYRRRIGQRAAEMIAEGKSLRQVSRELGSDRRTIRRGLDEIGVEAAPSKPGGKLEITGGFTPDYTGGGPRGRGSLPPASDPAKHREGYDSAASWIEDHWDVDEMSDQELRSMIGQYFPQMREIISDYYGL